MSHTSNMTDEMNTATNLTLDSNGGRAHMIGLMMALLPVSVLTMVST